MTRRPVSCAPRPSNPYERNFRPRGHTFVKGHATARARPAAGLAYRQKFFMKNEVLRDIDPPAALSWE